MFKNVASQKVTLLVIDTATNLPKTGDAGNLTAYVSKDDGTVTVLGDTSATELDATNAQGMYAFDLTQAETNADKLVFTGKSSTSGVRVVPLLVYTVPVGFTSQVAQTGDSYAIVSSGTHGNAALKALIDTLTAYVDTEVAAIKAKTDNLPSDPADASDIASALAAISAYVDTEIAAIKAKTDNLPSDPADASDIAAAFSSLADAIAALAAYVDTEVAAIKAKTDNLPSDPADASDLATAFSGVNTKLDTIDDLLDSEIAAIKAKTDLIPASPAAVGDIPSAATIADAVWDEAIADHDNAGSTGEALAAAGSAGDPWVTAIPGTYTAGQAGYVVGTAIPASIAALPTDADVKTQAASALTDYDPPTRTEATADKDAILSAVAVVDGNVDAILEDTGDTLPELIEDIEGGGGGGGGSVEIVTMEVPVGEHYVETGDALTPFRFKTYQLVEGVRVLHTYDDIVLALYIDGVLSGTVPTCTELSEGLMQLAGTLPAITAGQRLRIAASSDDADVEDEDVWYGIVAAASSGAGGGVVIGRYDDEDADSPSITCKVGELGVAKSVSVADAAGEPVDLTDWGDKQIVIERARGNREDVQVIANASITISGDDNEIFSFTPNSTVLERPGDFRWSLREVSTGDVIIDGRISVSYSPMEDA